MKRLCFTYIVGLVALLALTYTSDAQAKIFKNTYVSFEYPDNWDCHLENTEWICRASTDKESKEAIIVLTAKEVGPVDTFDGYISHLATPQTPIYKGKQGIKSKVVYPPKKVNINDQPWVDGLHSASEVPNYFTRYLATVKDKIAILFTCTAHKDFYTKYNMAFFKAVQSLRVIANKNLLESPNGVRASGETLGSAIGPAMPSDLIIGEAEPTAPVATNSGGGSKGLLIGLAIILAALGVYIFIKSRKKNE